MNAPIDCDVLIVGGGPTGVTLGLLGSVISVARFIRSAEIG